jgi:uncharacterized delta-60 repeat protein
MGARTGYVRLDIGGAQVHDDAAAIAVQSTGKIVLAGMTGVQQGNFSYRRVVLARFTAEGDVDPTFGGGGTGRVVLPMFYAPGEGNDELTSIALDQGGHLPSGDGLTIVGHTLGRNNAFVARLTADGAFDGGFGTPLDGGGRSGYVLFEASHAGGVQRGVSTIAGARILRDGKIAIVGSGDDRGLTFLRLHADGSLDPDFAEDGRVTIKFSGPAEFDEPAALALQGNGKLVAAGYATSRATGTPHTDFFVARVLADGAIDTAFGDGLGRAVVQVSTFEDAAFALAVEPSGNLVAGGDAQAGSSVDFDFALTRLFGDPDRIFQGTFQSGF